MEKVETTIPTALLLTSIRRLATRNRRAVTDLLVHASLQGLKVVYRRSAPTVVETTIHCLSVRSLPAISVGRQVVRILTTLKSAGITTKTTLSTL